MQRRYNAMVRKMHIRSIKNYTPTFPPLRSAGQTHHHSKDIAFHCAFFDLLWIMYQKAQELRMLISKDSCQTHRVETRHSIRRYQSLGATVGVTADGQRYTTVRPLVNDHGCHHEKKSFPRGSTPEQQLKQSRTNHLAPSVAFLLSTRTATSKRMRYGR